MSHIFAVESVQQSIIASNDRDRIIAWLKWNDRNGIYSDNDCDNEGLPRLTLEMAKEYMTQQVGEF
jgi:hypothetical protein